ncbi:polysaccharide deacetylase family protein [Thermocrinis minervae]|uniref:DUF2334 domain-containing protein n=1 Tax=Thermocrinis minervae TaxID=381751 RepID=A0A1M6T7B3_9AQUI|nr:polysaccharide deacetylase family protein [Thermocrinis minervae]SHK52865.1 hypothetical protein SAMN05444391_1332 [Thermocrinis minervae]
MEVLVELHDVCPFYFEELVRAFKLLESSNVKKFSLLVIPNFLEKYPICSHERFLRAIKDLKQEVVLHGYTHSSRIRFRDLPFTYREGEFGGLSYEETYQRIYMALELLDACSIKSKTFVPPAWISNPHIENILRDLGLRFLGLRNRIVDLQKAIGLPSPSLTFSNRPILSYLSLKLMPGLLNLTKNYRLLRLAIHMKDMRDKRKVAMWRLILRRLKNRRFVSYEETFGSCGLAPSF